MKILLCTLAAASVALVVASSARADFEIASDGSRDPAPILVSSVEVGNGALSGVLINRSPRMVRDVELLIRHVWFWDDERHPGPESPGTAEFYTVPAEISPGGRMLFAYPFSGESPRSGGHFETQVEVVAYTEIGK